MPRCPMSSPSLVVRVFLVLHVVAGTIAVGVGLVALLTVKGGRRHRRQGRAFLWSMAGVLGSATVLTLVGRNPYFAGLTASSLIATFSGWRVLRRKRPDLDPSQRATRLDWGVALVALAVAAMLLALGHGGRLTRNVPVVLALGYGTTAYALWDLWRFRWPLARPFSPRLWLYEHLVKMIGAYFGTVAAFSGSVLVFLDPPWRQLWATTLGQVLAIALLLRYRRRPTAEP